MSRRGGAEEERRQRGAETRAALITAARELFSTKGYFETGTEELVTAAGVGTRGAFYHHFADKKELFGAVFEQVEHDLVGRVTASEPALDPLERLTTGLQTFLNAALDRDVQRIVIIDGPAVLGWDGRRKIEGTSTFVMLEAVIREAVEVGSIAPQPVPELARLIIASVEEAALMIAHSPDPERTRKDAGTALRNLLSGLRAPEHPEAPRSAVPARTNVAKPPATRATARRPATT